MSAFDTTTNTGSTSFTNQWGTVALLPSESQQHAFGFPRSTGWKYFEFYVDDAGNANDLFVGISTDLTGLVWGGQSEQATANDAGATTGRTSWLSGQSISTGDTWMFAVDMNGTGKDHTGTNVVGTITDGSGNNLTPIYIEVGRNGAWLGGLGTFSWPMHGIDNHVLPMTLQESNSATAMVSLRVVTTSFVYAIPTGMTAWGDGPEGGGASSSTYTIAWDPAQHNGLITLTNSNLTALVTLGAASTSYYYTYSTPLPTTASGAGRRVVEFTYLEDAPSYFKPRFGLVDVNSTAGALNGTISHSSAYIFNANGAPNWRGTIKTSITQTLMLCNPDGTVKGGVHQFIVDHDNQYIWGITKPSNSTELNGMWAGNVSAGTRASPYKGSGVDGITITDSIGMRWFAMAYSNGTTSYVTINTGAQPYIAYPLMPGVSSYNGNRVVYNTLDTWQTGLGPSVSYSHGNLGIASNNAQILHMTSSGSRYSGKYFFQVYQGYTSTPGVAMVFTTGIRHADMTTVSASAHTKNNLVFEFKTTDPKVCRYSVTSTATWSGNIASTNFNSIWTSVAVDFDTGKLWIGVLNTNTRTNVWLNGGNPAAGTGELFTFTASTTMRAFSYMNNAGVHPNKPVIFVAEDNNVVDMPSGFLSWNGQGYTTSATSTPSGTSSAGSGGGRVLWPYGFMT